VCRALPRTGAFTRSGLPGIASVRAGGRTPRRGRRPRTRGAALYFRTAGVIVPLDGQIPSDGRRQRSRCVP
jgi:hypothetical protein